MTQDQIVVADIEQQGFAETALPHNNAETAVAAGILEALDTIGMSK
jgi:hypothetical protein